MAINRSDRFGTEQISSINNVEEYINEEYLQIIKDKIEDLKIKKKEIDNKITLYNSLNNTNKTLYNNIITDVKYTTILNSQLEIPKLIDELNTILRNLTTILTYKDIITLNNLNYKEDLFIDGKVSIIQGEFNQLQVENPKSSKAAVNKDFLQKELEKIEQVPQPLPPLKYLGTDSGGNLIWIS